MARSHRGWLADGVHFAWTGADIVTLDLRTDAYGLLTDAADRVRPRTGHAIASDDDAVMTALIEAGLVTPTRSARPAALSVPPPETAFLPGAAGDSARGPRLSPKLAAAAGALSATARFHRSTLPTLLLAVGATRRTPRSPVRLADAYAAFDAVLPWIPFEGQCLQRAFMLRRHLVRCGQPARWVIGVRTWPFLAHAWVQVGPCVVGDSLERVRTFTPILVV